MSRPSTSNIVSDPPPNTEEQTRAICAAHGDRPDELIEILHALQAELGFVPEPALPVIANALNLSRAEVYGVLSFYHDFRRAPAGRHVVKICRAEACQALHTEEVCRHAERRLGVKLGETSANSEFTLEAVYCLGICALSPAMMIEGNLFGCVDMTRFDAIIESLIDPQTWVLFGDAAALPMARTRSLIAAGRKTTTPVEIAPGRAACCGAAGRGRDPEWARGLRSGDTP
jgi:formate dehydrogenase subunit gamma